MTIADMNLARAERGIVGGRKKTITPEYVARAKSYIDGDWTKYGVIPTVERLAELLDISRMTLYEAPEFSDTLERLQRIQSDIVLQRGLMNEFNPNIAKLILSAKHGYVERSQVDQNVEVAAKPSDDVTQDFAQFVKNKTEAVIDSTATEISEQSSLDN